MKQLHPTGEVAAEHADELAYCEIKECPLALSLELRRQWPAEIGLDIRPTERPEVIRCRSAAIGVAEQAALLVKFVGLGQRQEQLVVISERQARRRLSFLMKRRREHKHLLGKHSARERDDRRIR